MHQEFRDETSDLNFLFVFDELVPTNLEVLYCTRLRGGVILFCCMTFSLTNLYPLCRIRIGKFGDFSEKDCLGQDI